MKVICEAIQDILVTQGDLDKDTAAKFRNLLMLKHRHQFEGPRKVDSGFTSMIKELIVKKLETSGSKSNMPSVNASRRGSDFNLGVLENGEGKRLELDEGKVNRPFLKKLPANSEGAVVLAGRTNILTKPISIFIRLRKPVVLEDLPEVDIPTRYLYFVVGSSTPKKGERVTCDVGRAMVSLYFVEFDQTPNVIVFTISRGAHLLINCSLNCSKRRTLRMISWRLWMSMWTTSRHCHGTGMSRTTLSLQLEKMRKKRNYRRMWRTLLMMTEGTEKLQAL